MKWKMNVRLTIARLLWGLVIMGIGVTFVLAVTSLISNSRLVSSQSRISEVAMPLEAANQRVKMAVKDFTLRKHAITQTRSLEALERWAGREPLEKAFSRSLDELAVLSRRAGAGEAGGKIEKLRNLFAETLEKDTALQEAMRVGLRLDNDLESQNASLDALGAQLHGNAKIFSDRIDQSIAQQVKSGPVPPEDGGGDGVSQLQELSRMSRIAGDLRLSIALLTNFGRRMLLAEDPERIDLIRSDQIEPVSQEAAAGLESLKAANVEMAGLRELVTRIENDFTALMQTLVDGEGSIAKLQRLRLLQRERLDALDESMNLSTRPLMASLNDLQSLSDGVRRRAENEAERVNVAVRFIIIMISVVAVLFMYLIGRIIYRRILHPIKKVVAFAETISEGDLTAEIERDHDDEIGTLVEKLSQMARSLNALIGQVQRSGIQVTSSATELSATSKQQEAVMKTQMESTNYVVKSVGEISSVSEELVETMKKVAGMSEQTADFANSGQSDLGQMEEAMRHMENASKSISGKLEAINEKAANITSVVTTITKVADQTNLLSLNAAIEAEKAGEYGRGFTVVAREIRRLADQTAVATLDIDQMVQEMQSAVSAGVMEMDAFIAEVQRSAENVGRISTQLTRIIEQVKALTPSFEGVNESMQFQSESAQQINASMLNLSEEMQQTVESLRESFLAIEQLNDASRGLQDEVSRFRVG